MMRLLVGMLVALRKAWQIQTGGRDGSSSYRMSSKRTFWIAYAFQSR
jgi:hypothetical protein